MPKIPHPKEVSSYRLVVLMSDLMKRLEGTGPYSPQTAHEILVRQTAVRIPAWDWSRGYHPPAAEIYSYLGFHLNNKLDWSDTTNALSKKVQEGPAKETEVFWSKGDTPADPV